MQRPLKLLIAGLVVIAAFAAWMVLRQGGETVVRNFVTDLPNAKDRRPSPQVFSVVSATLAGETLDAISVDLPSRVKWDVTVPDNAWFAFSLGLKEEAWKIKGDGVLFQIGVSDNVQYDELLSITVNPFGNESDRRWMHLTVDLSPYAGKTVELILNTYASPPPAPGTPPQADASGDLDLWGHPRIITR
jgi:hypothetical protein